ncbi:uncharacterized protein LOC120977088 [Bufo bufo]|uniref:uncharacterized protein LOC120977088 n=1 Tax=Bufo bufo TaxID=8384 RepID=UPI001ABE27A1|nr:uncharacterized protein LOC120977088 [Bufo bufo]
MGEGSTGSLLSDLAENASYDCIQLMQQETSGFSHKKPLDNPDFECFVDGSRNMGEDGQFHTGYAVVTQHEVAIAEPLPPHMSAQEAELKALTEACKLAQGKKVNVYTDSRLAGNLPNSLSKCQEYGKETDPDLIEGTHNLQPRDWVVIKRHVRKGLVPRFDGPLQELLTTHTAVKVEGKPNWIHASHCKKVLEPQDEGPSADSSSDPERVSSVSSTE